MIIRRNKEIPWAVYDALSTFGRHLENGQTPHGLPNVLDRLSELPTSAAFNLGRAIADAAGLRWRRTGQDTTTFAPLSDLKLLDSHPDIAWLFLFHHNGYVREAALDTIGSPPTSPFFYAAIACRLNDWVAPVRRAAMDCVDRVLPHSGSEIAALVALDLLDRRVSWARWGFQENSRLDALFGDAPVVARLATLVQNGTVGSMARALLNSLRYPAIDRYLTILAAKAVQPAVRALALRCLINCEASWPVGIRLQMIDKIRGDRRRVIEFAKREIASPPLDRLIAAGLSDRSATVRLIAADAIIAKRPEMPLAKVIERLMCDKSPALRHRGDFMRRRLIPTM